LPTQSPLAQAVLAAVECAVSRVASIGDLELLPYSQASLMLEQSITLLTLVHRYAQEDLLILELSCSMAGLVQAYLTMEFVCCNVLMSYSHCEGST
jgi:hypothetical protein